MQKIIKLIGIFLFLIIGLTFLEMPIIVEWMNQMINKSLFFNILPIMIFTLPIFIWIGIVGLIEYIKKNKLTTEGEGKK